MEALDRRIVEVLSGLDWPLVTPVMKLLSATNEIGFVLIAVGVATVTRRPWLPVLTLMAIVVAGRVDAVLKALIARPRPPLSDPHVHPLVALPSDPSMPSGHALTSFTCAVVIGMWAPRLRTGVLAFAAAVAFSRVYLGVHYPSDVIAGAGVGCLLGWLLFRGWAWGARAAKDRLRR
jgi:membrane-associated phospholipid phosphatase